MAFCSKCGTEITSNVQFCSKCGAPVLKTKKVVRRKRTGLGGIESDKISELRSETSTLQQTPPTTPVNQDFAGVNETLWDDISSPIKMIFKYSAMVVSLIIFIIIVAIVGIIFIILDKGELFLTLGLKVIILMIGFYAIYKILSQSEVLEEEGVSRSRKVTSTMVVLIIVAVSFHFIGGGGVDFESDHFLEKFAKDVDSGDYEAACSIVMESNGAFLTGSRLQECIGYLQEDCNGCSLSLSVIESRDVGEPAEYTDNIMEYKIEIHNMGGLCKIWYGAKNTASGQYGISFLPDGDDILPLIAVDGTEYSSGGEFSC